MQALVLTVVLLASALPCRGKTYLRSAVGQDEGILSDEPSCEDLRLMWRFSRRQSRVPEMTNEIPTFRDPFIFNVWEEIPRPRNIAGTLRSGGRSWVKPVYGRIVQHAPSYHPRNNPEYSRAYQEVVRLMATNPEQEVRREGPPSSFRGIPRYVNNGGFQNLKNMIWAERAKELQQQRMLEDVAAARGKTPPQPVPRYNEVFREKPQPLYSDFLDFPVYVDDERDHASFADLSYDQSYRPNSRRLNPEIRSWRSWRPW